METEISIPKDLRDKVKVLVVEDNLLNQKLDSFILGNWGLQHEICSNGQLAIDRMQAGNQYDIVLMDIRMPVLDGYEATRIIRQEMQLTVPVIGITAHADENEKQKCLDIGMNHYITKPINEEELFMLIMTCLAPAEAVR
jgi:CheY-like chemotaxis protein